MLLQQRLAAERSESMIGKTLRILADQPLAGRTQHDAPDIDGEVILASAVTPGEFADVKITGADVYDMIGKPDEFGSRQSVPLPRLSSSRRLFRGRS